MSEERLNKYLAGKGVCSRRDADKLIEEGAVSVNGAVARLGTKVNEEDVVCVRGKQISTSVAKVVLKYYKPQGVVVTEKDPHAKNTIADVIKYPIRVTYAGRLDKDSEGLLLLTNDGDLIDAMMRARNHHEKEYIVKVNRKLEDSFFEKCTKGIYLPELETTTRPCTATQIGPYTFRIVLTQGLNRQIRRMCEACGYKVTSLKRTRVMNVTLGDLKPGEYKKLTQEERELLYVGTNHTQPMG